ncbi:hypothetical protein [Brasilonema sp. UFV-L1]|uniref:hypothetical protein n=1 Tax=Brasilonema sp. UFV-L1 TaxID=2234130 RepID=UPI00145EBD55|nr:hypothetical protein [Brasilonema sp. UFV-L1]NMG10592.1 hypothetical protein [Brasilonema sp. UFV-L1]
MLKLSFIHQSKQLTKFPCLKSGGIVGLLLRFEVVPTCALRSDIKSLQTSSQKLFPVCLFTLKSIIPQFLQEQHIHPHPLKGWAFSKIFVKTATIDHKEIGVLKNFKLIKAFMKVALERRAALITTQLNQHGIKRAIAAYTEMCLLNLYNSLACSHVETLDGHRGSGRLALGLNV